MSILWVFKTKIIIIEFFSKIAISLHIFYSHFPLHLNLKIDQVINSYKYYI